MELECMLIVFGFFLSSSESDGCDIGFKKINRTCEDENECETPDLCGENAQCVNTIGGYYCTCNKGFQSITPNFIADEWCADINECFEKTHSCSTDRVCVNTIGSYICKCPEGYREQRLDSSCEDIDECINPDVCGTNAVCVNHPGSFICECHPCYSNYGNNQSKCTDISPMHFCV